MHSFVHHRCHAVEHCYHTLTVGWFVLTALAAATVCCCCQYCGYAAGWLATMSSVDVLDTAHDCR